MNKFYAILMFCFSALVVSCKKEPLPGLPDGNAPIYTVRGMLDDDTLDLKVGLNNVVAHHGIAEEVGVMTYFGEMESVLKNEKFRIEIIRQEKIRTGSEVQVFKSENIPFLVHEKGRLSFDFGGVGNQLNTLQIQDKNGYFVNTNELELDKFGVHTISAKFDDYGTKTFNFQVKHGYDDRDLRAAYQVFGSDDQIHIEPVCSAVRHEWYINGTLVGTDTAYNGSIDNGVYEIAHKVFDEYNNSSMKSGLVRFKGGKTFWDMKLNYQTGSIFETYNYGRIIVSIFKNDVWYSSAYANSNKTKTFKVSEVNLVNDENYNLLSFQMAFDAVLYTEDKTDSLNLSNVSGKFLIGLP